MPTPVPGLTDEQLDSIFRACGPLDRKAREGFMAALADQLRGRSEIGDGELGRIIREARYVSGGHLRLGTGKYAG